MSMKTWMSPRSLQANMGPLSALAMGMHLMNWFTIKCIFLRRPTWTGLFILKMMCYTTFAEEVFFRGYLQNLLTARWGSTIGIVIAAMVFGIAHAGGGFLYIGLASFAGLVYGLGYHLSGRLWVPVAIHTALNTAHLILFTYPMAI